MNNFERYNSYTTTKFCEPVKDGETVVFLLSFRTAEGSDVKDKVSTKQSALLKERLTWPFRLGNDG